MEEVLKFLKNKDPKLCVIATVSKTGKPECAVMGYSVLNDFTLILSTDKTSRKWKNLLKNSKVALTFGWSFEELNIQYDGIAELVNEGKKLKECGDIYFTDHPEAKEFKDLPETVCMRIKPTWIRLTDYSQEPPRIEEKEF